MRRARRLIDLRLSLISFFLLARTSLTSELSKMISPGSSSRLRDLSACASRGGESLSSSSLSALLTCNSFLTLLALLSGDLLPSFTLFGCFNGSDLEPSKGRGGRSFDLFQEGWSLETFMSSGRKVRTSRFLRMELARSRLSCSFTMFMCCMLCSSLSLLLLTLLNLVCTAPSKTVASSLLRFPLLRLIRHQLKAFSSSPTCQVPCLSYPTS
mmetsp:Transcript_36907/g.115549  ORF Transcript_36907/g.115549 Transcript_36907/m.115549 type:complete len:212 (+) Transcript_36907:3508-4143(+)